MSPGRARGKLMTVGEVARLAGCSPDTVRTWDHEGLLPAQRTPGNQRRFLESDVRLFLQSTKGRVEGPAPSVGADPGALSPPSNLPHPAAVGQRRSSPPPSFAAPTELELELHEEAVALELLRVRKEKEAVARAMEQEARALAARTRAEQSRIKAERRLDDLRRFGRSIARDLPPLLQATIAADLETFISPNKFSASLDDSDARAFVQARVEQHRSRWREKEARAAELEVRALAREQLIASGKSHASRETRLWDSEAREEATREVARELEAEVRWSWREEEVRQLVEEILDDWDDEMDDEDDESDAGGLFR